MFTIASRRMLALVAGVASVLAVSIIGAAPAMATMTKTFSFSWTFKSPSGTGINRCLKITELGNVTFTEKQVPEPRTTIFEWNNIQVNNPTITVKVYGYGCSASANLNKMDLKQGWTGYSCSFNPALSLGVGAPASFVIGVAGWPTCGQRNQAFDFTTPDGPTNVFHQYNNGNTVDPADYSVTTAAGSASGPCYGVYVSINGYVTGNSDGFTSSPKEVCLPAQ